MNEIKFIVFPGLLIGHILDLVEATGVEPVSGKLQPQASTSVAFVFLFALTPPKGRIG